jgi:selenocysteine lyase/cysteine desulfurase
MFDLARIRADFPALQNGIYLHQAGIGLNPRPVIAEVQARWQFLLENGPWLMSRRDESFLHKQRTREALARHFNAPADCISMVPNVSTSMSIVMLGLPLGPGDEIITSEEEDSALFLPLYHLGRNKRGTVIKHLKLGETPEQILEAFSRLLTPRTRLVALSHVTQDRGIRLPVAEMCRLARERGIFTFIDGGQAAGQLKVDISAIDPDFYAILGYKWMAGPYGTGALYVAERMRDVLDISLTGSNVSTDIDFETGAVEWLPYPKRLEMGSVSYPVMAGLGVAVEYIEKTGIEVIQQRTQQLRRWFRSLLVKAPKVVCYEPEHAELATGMVAYGVAGVTGRDLAAYLHQHKVWCRALTVEPRHRATHRKGVYGLQGVRLCTAYFNSEEELERAAEIMAKMPR